VHTQEILYKAPPIPEIKTKKKIQKLLRVGISFLSRQRSAETYDLNLVQIMTARKSSSKTMPSGKRLDTIQGNNFKPLRNQKMSIASSTYYTNDDNFAQPKILNLNNDIEVKTELLLSKYLYTNGA